jgi:hypothetical protein
MLKLQYKTPRIVILRTSCQLHAQHNPHNLWGKRCRFLLDNKLGGGPRGGLSAAAKIKITVPMRIEPPTIQQVASRSRAANGLSKKR